MTYSIVGTTEAMNFRKSTKYLQAACRLINTDKISAQAASIRHLEIQESAMISSDTPR